MLAKLKSSKTILIAALAGACVLVFAILFMNLHFPSQKEAEVYETLRSETQLAEIYQTEEVLYAEEHPTETPLPQPTLEPTAELIATDPIDYFMAHTTQDSYAEWIRILSGEEPAIIDGAEHTIATRYSYAMFPGQDNAMAPQYLLQTIRQWVPESQITYEPYTYQDASSSYTWYNIIVTFPGTVTPDQQILYTAHYDSCIALTHEDPLQIAPGANDNGTGVAALLEALPTFAKTSFEKTLKVIFFSGEENFLQGSKHYLEMHGDDNIVGVVNMDMFGYDSDGDRCFEIHCGSLAESDPIGQAYRQAISDYDLGLTYDYFNYVVFENGDHTPFWERKIPCITIMENFNSDSTPGTGCANRDNTPNWHTSTDFIKDVSIPYAFDIARAGTITVLRLAGAQPILGAENAVIPAAAPANTAVVDPSAAEPAAEDVAGATPMAANE